jgi:hypothetical protein
MLRTNCVLVGRRWLLLTLLSLAGITSHATLGLGENTDDESLIYQGGETFQIGGSCAAMAYIEEAQLTYLISDAFKDEFPSFCYPEEPYDCSDYTSFLKGAGTLEAGVDGYYCKLNVK